MISKKYTLREAFEKRLLESGEYVNIEGLYTPCKKIVQKESWGNISVLSLYSYFGENKLKQARIQKRGNGAIEVTLNRENTTSNTADLVTSKLLSDDLYGIKASYSKSDYRESWSFTISINPNIIVRFEGEEETPFLELPPQVAYTC